MTDEEKYKTVEARNAATLREALKNLVDVIDRCDSGSPLWWHSGAKGVMPLKNAKAALAEPVRNCDKFRDVDGAYGQFMDYVKRENPSFVKASPMFTVWDALKWVLNKEGV